MTRGERHIKTTRSKGPARGPCRDAREDRRPRGAGGVREFFQSFFRFQSVEGRRPAWPARGRTSGRPEGATRHRRRLECALPNAHQASANSICPAAPPGAQDRASASCCTSHRCPWPGAAGRSSSRPQDSNNARGPDAHRRRRDWPSTSPRFPRRSACRRQSASTRSRWSSAFLRRSADRWQAR